MIRSILQRLADRWTIHETRCYDPNVLLAGGRYLLCLTLKTRTGRRSNLIVEVSRDELETLADDLTETLAITQPNGDGTYRWSIDEEAP